jgi:hypothetical protein
MNNYTKNYNMKKNKNNQYFENNIINNSNYDSNISNNQNFKKNNIIIDNQNLNLNNNIIIDDNDLNLNNNIIIDDNNLNLNNIIDNNDFENNIIDNNDFENNIIDNNDFINNIIDNKDLKNNIIDNKDLESCIIDDDICYIDSIYNESGNKDCDILNDELKWSFVNNLNYKDKFKFNIINKYQKIVPLLYYSLQLILRNNSYINIISNSSSIVNNINTDALLTITNNSSNKIKLTINKIQYMITPFIESFKLQYNYNQAFKYAYLNMINICYNLILPSLVEINSKLYNNYEKNLIIDNINNEFIIIYNNYKYVFIYHRFLKNIGFQLDLQNHIKNCIINVNLNFIINEKNKFIIILKYYYII